MDLSWQLGNGDMGVSVFSHADLCVNPATFASTLSSV